MTELNAQELLDWQKLHDWASDKPKDSYVGLACTNSDCPLANYLHDQTHKLWSIGPSIKPMDGTKNRLDKPGWINLLINKVDALSKSSESIAITREQFLQILQEVKPVQESEEMLKLADNASAHCRQPECTIIGTSTSLHGSEFERKVYLMTLRDGEKEIPFNLQVYADGTIIAEPRPPHEADYDDLDDGQDDWDEEAETDEYVDEYIAEEDDEDNNE